MADGIFKAGSDISTEVVVRRAPSGTLREDEFEARPAATFSHGANSKKWLVA